LPIVGGKSKDQDHSEMFLLTGFKHSDLEMLNKANTENDIILELDNIRNYKEFSCNENNFQCLNEKGTKIC
jgi:hypothetical protein